MMPPRAPDHRLHERRNAAPPLAIVISPASDADAQAFAGALADWTIVALCEYRVRGDLRDREIHVVIINAIDCSENELRLRIARAATEFPDTPLAVYVRIEDASERTLLEARLWNLTGVIGANEDGQPNQALRQVLDARAVWRSRQLVEALPRETPTWLGDFLQRAVAFGYVPLHCTLLARMSGVSLRSLDRKLHALGLPAVEHWLIRGRLTCVLDSFACGLRLVEDAGHDVGYAEPASVRRAAATHFGCSVTRAVESGGVPYIVDVWRAQIDHALAEQRERERERERERKKKRRARTKARESPLLTSSYWGKQP